MADNVSITAGSGVTIAADDIGGVQYQRVKISQGADGSATDVSSAAPLQVSLANHGANATAVKVDGSAVTQPVSGTITAVTSITNALPAGTNNIGDVDVLSIAAGDNNIGNVDIVSGTITTVSTVTNLSQLGGAAVPIGAGLETTAVRVTLPTDGTGKVGLNAGTNAIGKLAANSGVDIGDVDVTSIAAGDNNIGNVDIVSVPAPLSTTGGGTEATALRVTVASDSTGVLSVDDNGGALTVDNAGTFAVQVDGSALTALQLIDDTVSTSGSAATTKGVLAMGVYDATIPTAVDDGDAVALRTDAVGRVLIGNDPVTDDTTYVKKYYTNAGAVTDGIVWSPAAGKRWYVTNMIINTSAAATITFEDDLVAGDSAVMKFELAANGGMVCNFGHNPLASGEDAADLLVTTSAGNIYITITGYEV